MTSVTNTESKAAIAKHPVHPMLVVFPMAFLFAALASDIAYYYTGDMFWPRASMLLLAGGLVFGVLAAVAGLIDFLGIREARRRPSGWVHALGNVLVLVLAFINLLQRDVDQPINSTAFYLSVATALALGITGWLGGALAYKHGIGMASTDSESMADPTAPHR